MIHETKIGKKTIFFDDERHRFWDETGKTIQSVTTFTRIIDKSDALLGWATRLTAEYLLAKLANGEQITEIDIREAVQEHRRQKEEAADIGTQIHEWVSLWIKGEKPPIPEDERIQNGINAFLTFQKEYGLKWIESERIVYSEKHEYAGILDAIAKKSKELILVDFKSSNAIYPEHALQTAGYQIAFEEMTQKKIAHRLLIRFGKNDGTFEFRLLKENEKDAAAFLACVHLKRRLQELER
jgi:CRISPR/Cas system-associated exonuclease Cas4 (RecB family)